jgi:hypothetical protein
MLEARRETLMLWEDPPAFAAEIAEPGRRIGAADTVKAG